MKIPDATYASARRIVPRALFLAIALSIALPPLPLAAAEDALPDSQSFRDSTHEVRPASPHPFKAGESLRFSVQYGFIHAGTAWLEVPEVVEYHGKPCWRVVARAQSNGFFDRMYKVRNTIESLWERDSLYSLRYFEDRHEGHYTANDTLTFDYDSLRVRYKNGLMYPLPGHVQDALSSFYYTRFQALPIGGVVRFDYHASRKSAPMEVRILGREEIKTPAGKFKCLVIEPLLKAGGIFKNNGRLVIWITDDERRMPVLMRSKVLIGSISVVLQDYKTGS